MAQSSTKLTLNRAAIAALAAPASGRTYYRDSRQPGLCVCVTVAGSRTFYLYKWHNGKPVQERIGTTTELTVEQARGAVRKRLADAIVTGTDLQARKRAHSEGLTFGELFGHWMEYATQHKRTHQEDQRKFDKFLTQWAARQLSAIDSTDVERMHHAVKIKSGPYQANRVLELIKAMFNRATEQRIWKGENPAATVKKFPEQSRDRYLRPDEIGQFFAALQKLPQDQRDFFLLLLLTGQRRGAVQSMRWADIDLEQGLWTVPASDSKGKLAVTLPLVPKAVEIIAARANQGAFVFPSRGKTGHIVEPKKAWGLLRADAGLPGLRMHDLRRTLGSWQASQGASLGIIGKSLGHAHGSRATNVYARLDLEPVRAAVVSATDAILAAAKPAKHTSKRKGAARGKK